MLKHLLILNNKYFSLQVPNAKLQLFKCIISDQTEHALQPQWIPNLQYLSCWIGLLLLTWLTTRFSCQPYWQRASQEPYSSGLSLTSQKGPSGYLEEVRCPSHNTTGVPQCSVLGPLLVSVIQKHGFSYHCYVNDSPLFLSFHPDGPMTAACMSACLTDISCWMKDHHQLNLAMAELLVVPANPSFNYNFTIQLGTSTITPSKTARNLGFVNDDQLTFSDHITKTARSCRFALFNIKKIRPFLSEHATQLVLVLSRLDYCNALLAGLPASSIKPLQLIQNTAARFIFNEPKRMHVTSSRID